MSINLNNELSSKNVSFNQFIYNSNLYGLFAILPWEKGNVDNTGNKLYSIKFYETGHIEHNIRMQEMKKGQVKDTIEKDRRDKEFMSKIYHSNNYGDFKIVDRSPKNDGLYIIEFLNTGKREIYSKQRIDQGMVVDSLQKEINKGNLENYLHKEHVSRRGVRYTVLNQDENDKTKYYVKFLDSGNIELKSLKHILNNNVADSKQEKIKLEELISKARILNNNEIIITDVNITKTIQYEGKNNSTRTGYCVKFLKNGYIRYATSDQITSNELNNPYHLKSNKGYYGELPESVDRSGIVLKKLYARWNLMMERCYNPNNDRYNSYGYLGVTVCERWKCFANYFNDVQQLPGYDEEKIINDRDMYLDKDYVCDKLIEEGKLENKIYSPFTCIWMDNDDNMKLRFDKYVDEIDLNTLPKTESDLKFIINPEEQQEYFGNYIKARVYNDWYETYGYPYNDKIYNPKKPIPLIEKMDKYPLIIFLDK